MTARQHRLPERRLLCSGAVGQKSKTETLFKIVAAFIDQRTWKQADLARKVGTTTETIRKQLIELQEAGFKLESEKDHPHVYWSVPRGWVPGALAFNANEAKEVLRLIGRSPKGVLRDRVIDLALARLAGMGQPAAFDPSTVEPAGITDDEEKWLPLLEDAANEKVAVKMRYFTASRGKVTWRHVSVHRVGGAPRPQIVATCHDTGDLRRFRVASILEARVDRSVPFRATSPGALTKFDRESFGGFRDVGPVVACEFFVRDPESAWVEKNLPDPNITADPAPGGTRFRVATSSVSVLARFVAGLGEIAHAKTPELKAEIRTIAAAALANAN